MLSVFTETTVIWVYFICIFCDFLPIHHQSGINTAWLIYFYADINKNLVNHIPILLWSAAKTEVKAIKLLFNKFQYRECVWVRCGCCACFNMVHKVFPNYLKCIRSIAYCKYSKSWDAVTCLSHWFQLSKSGSVRAYTINILWHHFFNPMHVQLLDVRQTFIWWQRNIQIYIYYCDCFTVSCDRSHPHRS